MTRRHMARLAVVLALLMPTTAFAQQRTFYGSDGRVTGHSITGSNGATTIYDADGRVSGRTSIRAQRRSTAAMGAASALSRQPNHRADDMMQDTYTAPPAIQRLADQLRRGRHTHRRWCGGGWMTRHYIGGPVRKRDSGRSHPAVPAPRPDRYFEDDLRP